MRHAAVQACAVDRFCELPHALRQEVAWESNRSLLRRLPLFRQAGSELCRALQLGDGPPTCCQPTHACLPLPAPRDLAEPELRALSAMLLPVDLVPGQEMWWPGDAADSFVLLHEGAVEVRKA